MKKLLESIDSIEENKNTPAAPPAPRNPVAKNAMATIGGGGFGKHKNKKKTQQEKHKNSFMRELAETAVETKELRKLKESWKNFQENLTELNDIIVLLGNDKMDKLPVANAAQKYNLDKNQITQLLSNSNTAEINSKDGKTFRIGRPIVSEYGAQSTDPNAQSTNADNQGGNTNQQNKATNTYNNVQQNSPQTTGNIVDTLDDPDKIAGFTKDPQFINALKTNKTFADQLLKAFQTAGFK